MGWCQCGHHDGMVSGGSDHTAQYFCYISMFQTAEQLELDHLALALLLSAKLEVLGPLDGTLILPLAIRTLQPQNQLLGSLGLLPQDGLGLATESLLLAIVPASALGLLGLGGLLVLGHLHLDVLVALGAEGVTTFGHVNHGEASLDLL